MAANLPHGVVQIVQGNSPPKHPAGARPPVPPAPPMPPGAPRPGVMVAVQHPIPPPNMVVPAQYRERQAIYYSDIRRERMSESEAREKLAEFVIMRFEKLDNIDYDEDGYPTTPTWENVIRTEVKDIPKHEVSRQIRHLDLTSKPVAEKKSSLIPAQQRQLERAQEQLQHMDLDQRYHYVLVQIDHKLRKLDKRTAEYYSYSGKNKEVKKVTIGRRRSSSSHHKKPLYERISLTAYFKRIPKQEENAIAMLIEKEELIKRRAIQQSQPQQPQQIPFPPHHGHGHGHPHGLPPAANMPGRQQQGKQPKNQQQVIEVVHGKKGGVKVYHTGGGSPRSSRSSMYSDGFYSDDGSDYTPNSSIDSSESSRHHHRRRSRSRHRHHDRAEQFGIEAPRRHSKHEQHYIMDSVPMRIPLIPRPPSPPIALPMPIDLDAERAEAYHQGRAEAIEDLSYRPRTALPPRVVQRRPSFRLVDPRDAVRERYDDDLERLEQLRLEDDIRYREQRRLEEEDDMFLRRDSMRERMRRDSFRDLAIEDDEMMWEDRRAREPLRRRDTDFDRHRVQFDMEPRSVQFSNPFASLGARGRRHSTYYN